jgi:hypothetical protein
MHDDFVVKFPGRLRSAIEMSRAKNFSPFLTPSGSLCRRQWCNAKSSVGASSAPEIRMTADAKARADYWRLDAERPWRELSKQEKYDRLMAQKRAAEQEVKSTT